MTSLLIAAFPSSAGATATRATANAAAQTTIDAGASVIAAVLAASTAAGPTVFDGATADVAAADAQVAALDSPPNTDLVDLVTKTRTLLKTEHALLAAGGTAGETYNVLPCNKGIVATPPAPADAAAAGDAADQLQPEVDEVAEALTDLEPADNSFFLSLPVNGPTGQAIDLGDQANSTAQQVVRPDDVCDPKQSDPRVRPRLVPTPTATTPVSTMGEPDYITCGSPSSLPIFPVYFGNTGVYGPTVHGADRYDCRGHGVEVVRTIRTCLLDRPYGAYYEDPFVVNRCDVRYRFTLNEGFYQVNAALRGNRDWITQSRQNVIAFFPREAEERRLRGPVRASLISTLDERDYR